MSEDRLASARRVFAAQKATALFRVKGKWCPSRAVEKAIKEAEAAFATEDFERAEYLAAVVLCMAQRDTAKFQADPKAWIAKQHEAAS